MESRCLPAGPENGDAYSPPAAAESVPRAAVAESGISTALTKQRPQAQRLRRAAQPVRKGGGGSAGRSTGC